MPFILSTILLICFILPLHTFAADYHFGSSISMQRSRSLYDHQDGSRSDSLDLTLSPSLSTPIGQFSGNIGYSQDLNDSESVGNGPTDANLRYSYKAYDWALSTPYALALKPSFSVVIPVAKTSRLKDQLQTALAAGLAFIIKPDGKTTSDGNFNLAFGLTAGRNFHQYDDDINGIALNKYSSNQSLTLGYEISDWSFSIEYIHRSRWTYQNNVRESYVLSEDISYTINENFAVAIGHSNESPALKANGYESNFNVIDEDASIVYLGITASM